MQTFVFTDDLTAITYDWLKAVRPDIIDELKEAQYSTDLIDDVAPQLVEDEEFTIALSDYVLNAAVDWHSIARAIVQDVPAPFTPESEALAA